MVNLIGKKTKREIWRNLNDKWLGTKNVKGRESIAREHFCYTVL